MGAASGYFGGWFDLDFQRFIEIWTGIPVALRDHHYVRDFGAKFLAACAADGALWLARLGRRCAGRILARAEL